jgi:hypothetical protein
MRISTPARFALGAIAAIALLAGCSGHGSSLQSTSAVPSGQSAHQFGIRHLPSGTSVLPLGTLLRAPSGKVNGASYFACTHNNLMFVSDAANNQILIFTQSDEGETQCGAITGTEFSQPQGLDTDRAGDLYVANTSDSNILKFIPPYTGSPVVLTDPGQYPVDVATDCGNRIFVTNIITTGGGPGTLTAYTLTGHSPLHTYADSTVAREYFVTCDPSGNVFTTFLNSSSVAGVNEFKKPAFGATDLTNLTYQFPGGIRWTGGAGFFGSTYVDDQIGLTISKCAGGTGTCHTSVHMTSAGDPVTIDLNYSGDDFFTADAVLPGSQIWDLSNTFDVTTTLSGDQPVGVALYPNNQP